MQTFQEVLAASIADSTAVGNTVTETIIIPDYTFSAGYFYQGRALRLNLWGVISNVVTAVPTITFRVRFGAATLSATWATATAAIAANATANTNLTWRAEVEMICRSVGTAGSGIVIGNFALPNITGATSALVGEVMMPASAPAAGTLNTTIANVMSVSAQWSAANASNTVMVNRYTLESLT